jgi:hypothetical protein
MILKEVNLFFIKKRLDRNILKLYNLKKGSDCAGSFVAKCIFPAKISNQERKVRTLWSRYKELMKGKCKARPAPPVNPQGSP